MLDKKDIEVLEKENNNKVLATSFKQKKEILLSKLDKGELLSEDELKYMCENLSIIEDRLEGSDEVTSTCELNGRFFDVNWVDNDWGMPEYNEQPFEVEEREFIEISRSSVYVKKKGNVDIRNSDEILKELSEIIKGDYNMVKIEDIIRLYKYN